MKAFRKKQIIIEAIQFTGKKHRRMFIILPNSKKINNNVQNLIIPTLERNHICSIGDWIIKGIKGEFYPCKPDIFKLTYEEVNN